MVERHGFKEEGRGDEPYFISSDPEFEASLGRLDKLARAEALFATAFELDSLLSSGGLTKSFVHRSPGTAAGGSYPFPHIRLKLKPKNRAVSDISVVALRLPTDINSTPITHGRLYVAYIDSAGDHSFYLSTDQYSKLDGKLAFAEFGDGGVFPPSPDGLTAVNDEELFMLETILGENSDFELDLQRHGLEVKA